MHFVKHHASENGISSLIPIGPEAGACEDGG